MRGQGDLLSRPHAYGARGLVGEKSHQFLGKGDGRTYSIMLFATSRGFAPAIRTFVAAGEWKQFKFPITEFDGMDAHDLTGLFIGAGLPAGKFKIQIDEVSFQ